jgi:hypothetical protein
MSRKYWLLGCIVQIFFLINLKTAKYAGNWDQKSNFGLIIAAKILSNTF